VLSHHDSSAAPQTVQTALPVCGTKNFVSVRLYSVPQLHRTIVAILAICPQGTLDQPQSLSALIKLTRPPLLVGFHQAPRRCARRTKAAREGLGIIRRPPAA
jgi:hypothetical protein